MTYYYVVYGKNGKVKRFTSKIEACKFAMKHKPYMAGGLKAYLKKLGYKPGKPPADVSTPSRELKASVVKKTAKKKVRKRRRKRVNSFFGLPVLM